VPSIGEMAAKRASYHLTRASRQLAISVPKDVIFEALSLVSRAAPEGKVRKTRGTLFVAIVKRACAGRGSSLTTL
jgi:hypothetical protein